VSSDKLQPLLAEAQLALARAEEGDVAAGDEAIERLTAVLEARPPEWEGRALVAVEIARQLRRRFRRSFALSDLDAAATLLEQERGAAKGDAAVALAAEFALVLHRAATAPPVVDAETPAGQVPASERLLATARSIGEAALVGAQDSAERRALAYALGLVLADSGEHTQAIAMLREGAANGEPEPTLALAKVLAAEGTPAEQGEAVTILEGLSQRAGAAEAQTAFEAARFHGYWAVTRSMWAEAGAAYGRAIDAREVLRRRQVHSGAERAWLLEAGDVVSEAAYALARAGDAAAAVVALETGLAANMQLRLGVEVAGGEAPATEPLVYLAVSVHGAVAIIVATGLGFKSVFLEGVSRQSNHPRMLRYLASYRRWQETEDLAARDAWLAELDSTLTWLKKDVLEPVLAEIGGCRAATIVSDGALEPLPLHAAALAEIELGYAPTAAVLARAQALAATVATESVVAVADPGVSGYRPLVHAPGEAAIMASSFSERTVLLDERVRLAAVEGGLISSDVAHFACHARARFDDPLLSSLFLGGGDELTLARVIELELGDTRLVVLSACETALADVAIASEKTSLASGFLAAGVAGVIATAWAVSDRSTLLLIARFAELWRGQGVTPRRALSLAQQWLQDATATEIAGWARAQVLVSDRVAAGTLELVAGVMDRRPAAERPYAHPHFWAAFSYHGA